MADVLAAVIVIAPGVLGLWAYAISSALSLLR